MKTSSITGIVYECGNGLPDVGDYVTTADNDPYRVVQLTGPIHTGPPGAGDRVHAVLEPCDWDDLTDEEANIVCSCTVDEEVEA